MNHTTKILGHITEEEAKTLFDFRIKQQAIQTLFDLCSAKAHILEHEKEEWFTNVRGKHGIQEGVPISVDHKTLEIVEFKDEEEL